MIMAQLALAQSSPFHNQYFGVRTAISQPDFSVTIRQYLLQSCVAMLLRLSILKHQTGPSG
jgi:hypothetical protein